MASNQSWKLEDLGLSDELQQDIGLAEELQSGLYLSEFGSDSMKDIIQSLMDDTAQDSFYSTEDRGDSTAINDPFINYTPSTPINEHTTGIDCILKAPTACTAKVEDLSVTYLNRGQAYAMCLSCLPDRFQGTLLKSTLRLEFHDLRLRNCEELQIQEWSHDHSGQRMIEIDMVSSGGISNVQYTDDVINSVSFMWEPQNQNTVLSFKVHSLSSEFTAKKHGGERGVPFQLVMITYCVSTEERLCSNCACLIKVFKDKGADRKHKQDMQKREKMPPDEAAKYWQSTPVTRLTQLPIVSTSLSSDQKQSPNLSSTSPYYNSPNNSSTNYTIQQQSSIPTSPPQSCSANSLLMSVGSPVIAPCASVDETRQWLTDNRFTTYASLFANYGGSDLLRLSRKDVIDLCGPADGIRLYNTLHTRSVKRIYVSLDEDTAYHAIFLESLTVGHLREELARKLSVSPLLITAIHLQHTYGMLINVDDLCVVNMYDEQCFQMQVIKDDSDSIQIILKPPSITDISIPGLQSRS